MYFLTISNAFLCIQMNQLVESEVQKRLLEQRVQREKEVLMEREERDSQIAKIRKTHQREMQNLRQKYEATLVTSKF